MDSGMTFFLLFLPPQDSNKEKQLFSQTSWKSKETSELVRMHMNVVSIYLTIPWHVFLSFILDRLASGQEAEIGGLLADGLGP